MVKDKQKLLKDLDQLNKQAREESGHSLKDIRQAQDLSDRLAEAQAQRSQNFDYAEFANAVMSYLIESIAFLRPKPIKPIQPKNDATKYQQ